MGSCACNGNCLCISNGQKQEIRKGTHKRNRNRKKRKPKERGFVETCDECKGEGLPSED